MSAIRKGSGFCEKIWGYSKVISSTKTVEFIQEVHPDHPRRELKSFEELTRPKAKWITEAKQYYQSKEVDQNSNLHFGKGLLAN